MKPWRLWSGGLFIGGVDCGGCGDAEATLVCVTCVVGTHYPLCALGIIMGWLTWRGSAPTIHSCLLFGSFFKRYFLGGKITGTAVTFLRF